MLFIRRIYDSIHVSYEVYYSRESSSLFGKSSLHSSGESYKDQERVFCFFHVERFQKSRPGRPASLLLSLRVSPDVILFFFLSFFFSFMMLCMMLCFSYTILNCQQRRVLLRGLEPERHGLRSGQASRELRI